METAGIINDSTIIGSFSQEDHPDGYAPMDSVTREVRLFLGKLLCVVDATVPNKEQNRAVKSIVRKDIDQLYLSLEASAFPGRSMGYQSTGHLLEPIAL